MSNAVLRTGITSRVLGAAIGVCVAASALAACGGTSGASGSDTFTFGMSSDPGNLDPQSSASGNLYQMSYFAYDPLLNVDSTGDIKSELATAWHVDGQTVTLTLHKDITCADGSAFTAQTAADNISYLADPKNGSPFTGVFIPAGAKATADTAANTLTIALPAPAPFILNGLAGVPMVCAKGMANRKSLAGTTDGTGPYQLTQAVPNDHYTLTRRTGYTWGPDGATTAAAGMPAQLTVKIVPNETTAANLLLSKELNAAVILGPDEQRLSAANMFAASFSANTGEMWFNQAAGRPGVDQHVRMALTQAVDLGQVEKVLTSGRGTPGTTLASAAPAACPGDSVTRALPAHALATAKSLLDADGWAPGPDGIRVKDGKQLAVTFLYITQAGAAASAAAELAQQDWTQLGVKVTLEGQDDTQSTNTLFSTGNWDIAWAPVNVSSPDQMVPFLSGPAPAQGENFAHINNAAYTAAVQNAAKVAGSAGCSQWLAADSLVVADADVIPFANQVEKIFGSDAHFTVTGWLLPTSIRMTNS